MGSPKYLGLPAIGLTQANNHLGEANLGLVVSSRDIISSEINRHAPFIQILTTTPSRHSCRFSTSALAISAMAGVAFFRFFLSHVYDIIQMSLPEDICKPDDQR